MVILPDHTTEIQDTPTITTTTTTASYGQGRVTSLRIQFYVRLPDSVSRSPRSATNFVVPQATLRQIVSQDGDTIGAVVRNSVAPSLTGREGAEPLGGWEVVGVACVVLVSVAVFSAVVAGVVLAAHKYKQR